VLVGHANLAPLGWLLARLCRARLVGFIYGIEVWKPLKPLRLWALCRADRIIAISDYTRRRAIKANKLPAPKIRLLHNCLDPGPAISPPRPAQSSHRSLLTVARMSRSERYKGHDYVIRAMPALLACFPDLTYDVVGEGDWQPELQALAERAGVGPAVHFHGFVPDAELNDLYARASIFVMPSRAEGFGFVFLEAMAHELPVIAGNRDATPEVVVDGDTGLLVDPTSVEAITGAISRLLSDDCLRQKMGQAALTHSQDNFSFDTFQARLAGYLLETKSVHPRR
jgi:glycosyltransferase involved in cell wall biosynthesis